MRAVRRVRRVRERDSRLGLQQAAVEESIHAAELDRVRALLDEVPTFGAGDAAAFAAHRAALAAISSAASIARAQLEMSRDITTEARSRWQDDATRLDAVDMLLGRRQDERDEEAARVEVREQDDLASQAWQRRRAQEGDGS
jgi:flagellar export protein FliJ